MPVALTSFGDKVVAEAPAVLGLEDDRLGNLLGSDEFRLEEEIPKAHAD
jgi:hypothetical protein